MATSLPSSDPTAFQHEPLDHTQLSIRLIRINSGLSAEGHIRCEISHTTTNARYTCLSYRWGDTSTSTLKVIMLNGKTIHRTSESARLSTCGLHRASYVALHKGKLLDRCLVYKPIRQFREKSPGCSNGQNLRQRMARPHMAREDVGRWSDSRSICKRIRSHLLQSRRSY